MSERSDNEHWYDEHAAPVLGWVDSSVETGPFLLYSDGGWEVKLSGYPYQVIAEGDLCDKEEVVRQLAAEDALADLCVETLRKLRPGALLENADPKACMAQFVSGSRENAEYLRRCLDSEPPMPTAAELLERHPEAAHPCAPMSEGTTLRTATVRTMYPRTCDRLTPAERDELNRLWKEDCSCSMGDRPPSPPAANTRRLLELEAKKRGGR